MPAVGVKLRDYQLACRQAIYQHYKAGVRRALVVLPTGTGKTVIFASLPEFFRMKHRMLVLAHREELLQQAADKFRRANPGLAVGIEQAESRSDPAARVVIASVQTLGRRGSPRLRALDPAQFKLIVVDEAHHAVAPSYRTVLDQFRLFDPGTEKLLLGFTATPYRGDKQGLDQVFEKIIFTRTIGEMIAAGYLCDIAGFRVSSATDLDGVSTRLGDFALDELSRAVNEERRNRLVVEAYRALVPDKKCVVFSVDVAHSRELAALFERHGVPARAVWGEMPAEERRQAIDE